MKKGDPVYVLDDGLKKLRDLVPSMPPNHYGVVDAIEDDYVFVLFDDTGQLSPYPKELVRLRGRGMAGE